MSGIQARSDTGIELTGVTKTYPGRRATVALAEVDLSIPDRQFVSILGPSGCGKSTLLNLLAGFDRPTSGTVTVFGKAVSAPGPERAVVFQDATLMPWLSVWENIVFSARLKGSKPDEYGQLARELVSAVGLAGFERHLPDQLSGGMRQRVGIARALLMRPQVLLMDEPFGALDAQTRLQMQQLLMEVWSKYRKTVLFITHDIDEAIFLSDTVYVMSARPGRISRRLDIGLPRPRTIEHLTSAAFNEMRRSVFGAIELIH